MPKETFGTIDYDSFPTSMRDLPKRIESGLQKKLTATIDGVQVEVEIEESSRDRRHTRAYMATVNFRLLYGKDGLCSRV